MARMIEGLEAEVSSRDRALRLASAELAVLRNPRPIPCPACPESAGHEIGTVLAVAVALVAAGFGLGVLTAR